MKRDRAVDWIESAVLLAVAGRVRLSREHSATVSLRVLSSGRYSAAQIRVRRHELFLQSEPLAYQHVWCIIAIELKC